MTEATIRNTIVRFVSADITEQEVDAIVNAANSSLMGGGGVDGAIHRKGGPAILEECEKIRRTRWKEGLAVGEAVITTAGKLKARFVIHTVGPVWNGGKYDEAKLLANCYLNSLRLASSRGLASIAFPAISTGAFGYPMRNASEVALNAVKDFLSGNDTTLREVVFVLFTSRDLEVYEQSARSIFA